MNNLLINEANPESNESVVRQHSGIMKAKLVYSLTLFTGGPLITNLRGHTKRVNAVVVTRDNNFLVTSGEDSLINIWNTNNHDCLHTLKMTGKGESCLVLTPDDRLVLATAGLGVGIWDLDTGENFH
jgi:WD40 repeat protein